MPLGATAEAWETLRSFIDANERGEAADALVTMLIENGHDADDIKSEFNDKDIRTALTAYIKDDDADDWGDEEEDDYDEDEER